MDYIHRFEDICGHMQGDEGDAHKSFPLLHPYPSSYIFLFDEVTHRKCCSGITFFSLTFLIFLSEFENEVTQVVFSFHKTRCDVLIFQLFWSVK